VVLRTIAHYHASGQQEDTSGVLAVSGVIATEDGWAALEGEWKKVLARFSVSYFSQAEYAHSVGAFDGWKGKEEWRQTFIQQLHAVITKHRDHAVCVGVKAEDFVAINNEYELAETFGEGHPSAGSYAVAARYCLGFASRWIKENRPGTAFAHIFEAGDTGQAAFRAAMQPTFIGNAVTIMPKKDPDTGQWVRPLEVADLVAGVCREWFEKAFPDSGGQSVPAGSPSEPFKALVKWSCISSTMTI